MTLQNKGETYQPIIAPIRRVRLDAMLSATSALAFDDRNL
jgi:hypothetical protein